MVWPSGLTSSDIHEPLLVVNVILRAALRGKLGFFGPAAGPCAVAAFGVLATVNTIAPSVAIARLMMLLPLMYAPETREMRVRIYRRFTGRWFAAATVNAERLTP
jgi:hypothetical protein